MLQGKICIIWSSSLCRVGAEALHHLLIARVSWIGTVLGICTDSALHLMTAAVGFNYRRWSRWSTRIDKSWPKIRCAIVVVTRYTFLWHSDCIDLYIKPTKSGVPGISKLILLIVYCQAQDSPCRLVMLVAGVLQVQRENKTRGKKKEKQFSRPASNTDQSRRVYSLGLV